MLTETRRLRYERADSSFLFSVSCVCFAFADNSFAVLPASSFSGVGEIGKEAFCLFRGDALCPCRTHACFAVFRVNLVKRLRDAVLFILF